MIEKEQELFQEIIQIIKKLRSPEGCPWDRKQTPSTVKSYLIEEMFELIDAIDENNPDYVSEEAGDILFMLLFLINMYEEKQELSLAETLGRIQKKMVFRHPHVFGDISVNSADEVKENWQVLKEKEGKVREQLLDRIPRSMPALVLANTITKKASEVGFDWGCAGAVITKIKEETSEFEKALENGSALKWQEELGDMFFSLVNLSRHLDIDPELALRRTCDKFRTRFNYIEEKVKSQGKQLEQTTLQEMDRLWEEAKAASNSSAT